MGAKKNFMYYIWDVNYYYMLIPPYLRIISLKIYNSIIHCNINILNLEECAIPLN